MLCYVQLFYKGEGKTTKQPLRPLQKVCEVKNRIHGSLFKKFTFFQGQSTKRLLPNANVICIDAAKSRKCADSQLLS